MTGKKSRNRSRTPLNDKDLDDLVETVRDAAAGEIMPRFRNLDPDDVRAKNGPTDLVTIADQAAERRMTKGVSRIWPQAVVVGEEAVADKPDLVAAIATAERCVIVDPVDGTGNFAAGLALFGVILAVVERGETIFGILYDPVMDDWMSAMQGGGAWLSKTGKVTSPLTTRAPRTLSEARGFVPFDNMPGADRVAWMDGMRAVRQVQDLRCSCHEYRSLASGEADFVAAPKPKPWDHAAGVLVVQEAGGWARLDRQSDYAASNAAGTLVVASRRVVGICVEELLHNGT